MEDYVKVQWYDDCIISLPSYVVPKCYTMNVLKIHIRPYAPLVQLILYQIPILLSSLRDFNLGHCNIRFYTRRFNGF